MLKVKAKALVKVNLMDIFKPILPVIIIMSLITGCTASHTDDRSAGGSGDSGAGQRFTDNTQSEEMSKIETAKINAQLGIAYLEKKNVQRAKQKLLLALQQAPNIPEPWYSMAYFLEATGNTDEARKYYMKSLQVAPGRGDVENNYGTFLCRSGHYQESIKHFMLATRAPDYLDPAAAYENAGICSMKIKAYSQASFYFSQALLKDPARNLSLLKLAEVDIKLKKFKAARQLLNQFTLVSQPTPEYASIIEQLNNADRNKAG
ncbi:MAG TPA: type IV pilus biogenesis/stability protein PilW [Gammaproteobacteria bacterium]|jgi:type IV pilus assembly protein PilF|nr:type IV pilus biogenesis/stability protein PilW [Gammaproteobacteria bacterium]